MGYDGNIAWHNTPIREDTGDEKLMLVELGEKFPGLEFREGHTNVQVDAMEKVGDRDTYRVVGTRKDGFPGDRPSQFRRANRPAREVLHNHAERDRRIS